jgi:iron complex outermembrane receptor protein
MGIGKNAWNAYLFIANLTDRRANLTTNNTLFAYQTPGITRFSTNQPLTAGAEFTTKF